MNQAAYASKKFDMPFRTKFSHEEYLNALYNKNIYYKNKEFEIISEYKGRNSYILIKDRYGIVQINSGALLQGVKPVISSALDKSNYFINKAREVHGDRYDYSKVEYKGYHSKVIITCAEHGDFLQAVCSHLNGSGCFFCGNNEKINTHLYSQEAFINKANIIHNNKYDYSSVVYTKAKNTIEIICPTHGVFHQKAAAHLHGGGCLKCANETISKKLSLSQEAFIKKAQEVHGDKYDYSKSVYIKGTDKIEIICPVHGSFYQQAASHLRGTNCNKCQLKALAINKESWVNSGKGRDGIFYIIKCWDNDELFYKLGITHKDSVAKRYKGKISMPYNYEVIYQYSNCNKNLIWDIESNLKSYIKPIRYKPSKKFNGCLTECFIDYDSVKSKLRIN